VVIKEAKRRGVYPAQLIESMVRKKFNPFGPYGHQRRGGLHPETAQQRPTR
jgi:hypothetical protein